MSGFRRAALLALAVGVPVSANAAVLWRGDFSTGNFSQWDSLEEAAPNRLQVVTSPVRKGKYAMRVEVRQGDLVFSGTRAEADGFTEVEGNERYYAWSTFFPSDYPNSTEWQVFTQWHHSGLDGSPPLEFDADSEQIKLATLGDKVVWSTPLVRNVWHDFVFHVKFSANASVGFVEIWLDGAKVLNKFSMATLYAGQTVYFKQGYYRSQTLGGTQVLYHADTIEGETLADVTPAPPPPPPPAADFTLSVADASQSIVQGQSATFHVTTSALNGFTGTVALAASGLPPGATAHAESGSGGNALVIVSTTSSAALGTSHISITGTSGGLIHTVSASLAITALAPPPASGDFSLALGSTTATAVQGGAASFTVAVSRSGGFANGISIDATGLPAGVTALPASTSGATATLDLAAAASVAAGSYPFTVTGTSGSLQRTTAATLIVTAAPVVDPGPVVTPPPAPVPAPPPAPAASAGGCTSGSTPSGWALSLLAMLFWRARRRFRAL